MTYRYLQAVLLSSAALAPGRAGADCKSPTTQLEINECAGDELRAADAELNRVYKQALDKGDDSYRKRLQAAQRAWLLFRDAHVASLYPPEDQEAHGSARPMCKPLLLKQLTVERTAQLRLLLHPVDGDVCSP